MSDIKTEVIEDRGDDFTPTGEDAVVTVPESEAEATRDDKGRFVKPKPGVAGKAAEEGAETEVVEGEAESTGEESGEETGEEEEEETTEAAPRDVPYKRFKEVVEQRKQLQAKLAEADAAVKAAGKQETKDSTEAAARETKLEAMYTKVEEARADGDVKLAAQLQREIDGINRTADRVDTVAATRREVFAAQQNTTFDGMLDYLEQVRPVLDPNAPEFDARVVQELDFQVRAYEKMDMPASQALRRAAALLFAEDPFAKAPTKTADVIPLARRTDVSKNVDASERTPPRGGRSGGDNPGKIDVSKLTDDEFDKLPESKKSQLRGDVM